MLAGFIVCGKVTAQSVILQHPKHGQSLDDDKYLKGFDEQAVRDELKQKGVPKKNYNEIIFSRKQKYIALQKGLTLRSPSIPVSEPLSVSSACNNADFEDGNFTNWLAATGTCDVFPTFWTAGFVIGPPNDIETDGFSQHDILTDPTGFDSHAGLTAGIPNIPYLAPGGGGVSVRLGNSDVNYGTEKLGYMINVTPTNNFYSYKYAVVLEDPDGHTSSQQPSFSVLLRNGSGVIVTDPCVSFSINGLAAAVDTSFHPFLETDAVGNIVTSYYKKWATKMVDLTPYIGQTVTLEFITQDCTLGAHYGYAYIDASCPHLQTPMTYCQGNTTGVLIAPAGYLSYQWYNSSGMPIPGATNDTLIIDHPVMGATYSVHLNSGCQNVLFVTLTTDSSTAISNTASIQPTCNGYSNGSAYVVQTSGGGPFTYVWHNSAGAVITPSGSPDSLTNLAAGTYTVTVQSAYGCSVTDVVNIAQPPPILNHSGTPICPNDPQVDLSAPAGSAYQWYDPSNNVISGANIPAYTVSSPSVGQTYTVHYQPPVGCPISLIDSFYLYIIGPPPYNVTNATCFGYNNGSASLAAPVSNPLGAAGPYTYSWAYQGSSAVISTNDSLSNIFAGNYLVTATSAGGCVVTIPVVVDQLASSYDSLKLKTNFCPEDDPIVLHAPPGYSSYTWYSNQNATGPIVSTSDSLIVYQPSLGDNYTLEMPGIAPDSCNIILKIKLDYSAPPASPDFITKVNVFSPNNDGVNDYFMLNEKSFKYISDFHIEIYNRWGSSAFKSDDVTSQWDGKINGVSASEGVYYWIAHYKQACLVNPPLLTVHGFVHIVK